MFRPLETDRLLIRQARLDDAAGVAARRNDPDVARYQAWELPYSLEHAESWLADVEKADGPQIDEWWMGIVILKETGEDLGEVVCQLTWKGRSAEIGYTFEKRHWGKGYAVEAAAALVDWLYEVAGVTRVFGMLHPDNPPSAMVLERVGMLFEGHTKSSFWVGDEVSDDWIYGMTRDDWEAWRGRPRHAPADVRLVQIDQENESKVFKLKTHWTQRVFVAPMEWSFADALFPEVVNGAPVVPWMRAVEVDGELAGFVMLALRTEHHPEPFLWRLLVDRMHQRRGIGGRVLELVSDECRAMGDTTLLTSWVEGRGSPRPFYERHGFVPTGRIVDDETEARLTL